MRINLHERSRSRVGRTPDSRLRTPSTQSARIDLTAAVLVLLLGIIIAFLAWRSSQPPPPVSQIPTGPIRLVGVRPDASDDLYDADGRKTGTLFYDQSYFNDWGTNRLLREFIFEFDSTNQAEISGSFKYQITEAKYNFSGTSSFQVERLVDGRQRIIARVQFPSTYRKQVLFFPRRNIPVNYADVTVKFFFQGEDEDNVRFQGPFQTGQKIKHPNGIELSFPPPDADKPQLAHVRIRSTNTQTFAHSRQVRVKGSNGKILQATHVSSSSGGSAGNRVLLKFPGTRHAEIEEVVLVQPKVAEFKNIRIRYPDRPSRHYPSFLDDLSVALSRTNTVQQWQNKPFQSPMEAIDTLPLLRGGLIKRAWSIIQRPPGGEKEKVDLKALPQETREMIRKTCHQWLESPTRDLQLAAVGLGLSTGWPEFGVPGVQLLQSPSAYFRSQASDLLGKHLGDLDDASMTEIERLLMEATSTRNYYQVMQAMRDSQHPLSKDILSRLARLSESPPVWIRSMAYLNHSELESLSKDDLKVRIRYFLARGKPTTLTDAEKEEAWAMIPVLLNPELWAQDVNAFMSVFRAVRQSPHREPILQALIQLMSQEEHPTWRAGIYLDFVRTINGWFEKDFGGFGTKRKRNEKIKLTDEEWWAVFKEIRAWEKARGNL